MAGSLACLEQQQQQQAQPREVEEAARPAPPGWPLERLRLMEVDVRGFAQGE